MLNSIEKRSPSRPTRCVTPPSAGSYIAAHDISDGVETVTVDVPLPTLATGPHVLRARSFAQGLAVAAAWALWATALQPWLAGAFGGGAIGAAARYLADLKAAHTKNPAMVWADFAQSVFNLKEFLYLK